MLDRTAPSSTHTRAGRKPPPTSRRRRARRSILPEIPTTIPIPSTSAMSRCEFVRTSIIVPRSFSHSILKKICRKLKCRKMGVISRQTSPCITSGTSSSALPSGMSAMKKLGTHSDFFPNSSATSRTDTPISTPVTGPTRNERGLKLPPLRIGPGVSRVIGGSRDHAPIVFAGLCRIQGGSARADGREPSKALRRSPPDSRSRAIAAHALENICEIFLAGTPTLRQVFHPILPLDS